MAEKSLTDKTVKGVGWNSVDRIVNYGIGFIVGIVLARLLSPEEYHRYLYGHLQYYP